MGAFYKRNAKWSEHLEELLEAISQVTPLYHSRDFPDSAILSRLSVAVKGCA
jgi:hypothetical protein